MDDQQLKHMADRFLGWRLPEDFKPDGGISFDADAAKKINAKNHRYEPVGTNLFTGAQADAMVRHMVEGLPAEERREVAWLIEAPGQNYLAVWAIGGSHCFRWTKDHAKAVRFWTRMQADDVMMAVRALNPDLFAFAVNLGDASPVEHAWIDVGRPVPRHGSGPAGFYPEAPPRPPGIREVG